MSKLYLVSMHWLSGFDELGSGLSQIAGSRHASRQMSCSLFEIEGSLCMREIYIAKVPVADWTIRLLKIATSL